jgi:predicted SnoaL-like aldol condensation-catalyzing enzyme
MFKPFALAATLIAFALSAPAYAQNLTAQEQANVQTALGLTAAMAAKDVGRASAYLDDGYIQHNPNVPTGKAGFVGFFTPRWKDQKPAEPLQPVVTVAKGDLVTFVFRQPRPEPTDPSKTYDSFSFDAYRIANGKIAEHWDGGIKNPPAPPAAR